MAPPPNRSEGRNVHLYNKVDRDTVIGGLRLTSGITNANFYEMVEIIIIFKDTFLLRGEDRITIPKDDSPLQPGDYFIESPGMSSSDAFTLKAKVNLLLASFDINNEPILVRMMPL